jgi:hypothetical protein
MEIISLPDIEIEDAPTAEEIENFRREQVNIMAFGHYVDKNAIPGAPKELHYQWGPDTPDEIARMAGLGYKLNDALAARSPYLTSTENGENKILDCRCYTIRVEKHNAMVEAKEMAKQLKQDPRKTYKDVSAEIGGEYVRPLLEKEVAETNTRQVLSGAEARVEILKDKQ